jgi:hypothetical protein
MKIVDGIPIELDIYKGRNEKTPTVKSVAFFPV